jgi:redox-sensitive bicupin YhaK (pirin superfamily)
MLDGRMRHRDNHGNEGLLTPGSVQWMTAGRGLVHSEMPEQHEGRMRGFQLWVNLPSREKMTDPRYQEFPAERIPEVAVSPEVSVRVIAGEVQGVRGPIAQPATDPLYLDVSLAAGSTWSYVLPEGHNVFAYVFEGQVRVGEGEDARDVQAQELAVLGGGDVFNVSAAQAARLILVAGRPLREPIARHGPFVMNTRQELMQAFVDYQEGRF